MQSEDLSIVEIGTFHWQHQRITAQIKTLK